MLGLPLSAFALPAPLAGAAAGGASADTLSSYPILPRSCLALSLTCFGVKEVSQQPALTQAACKA